MPYVHISAKDLRPGMFIVDTEISWQNRPYLYSKTGLIKTKEEIEEILAEGYDEAYYDPDKSHLDPAQKDSRNNDLLADNALNTPLEPKVPFASELKNAQGIYTDCLNQVEHMLGEARRGKIDHSTSKNLVTNLVGSINRHPDALSSLSKIKGFDEYTFAHSINVAIFSIAFGLALGLSGDAVNRLGEAALLHDFGKMRVPKEILNAVRALKPEELVIMQTHPQLGAEMLAKVPGMTEDVINGVLDHHEKYNGSGYPNKKKGAEISPFARIISVADVYDALSSKRVYRDAVPPNKALATMYSVRDQSWEPGLCECFIKLLGIYPVGSCVSLTMGYKGIVSKSNFNAPLYPTVLLCKAPNGNAINPPQVLDLSTQHDLQIVKALPPDALKVTLTDIV